MRSTVMRFLAAGAVAAGLTVGFTGTAGAVATTDAAQPPVACAPGSAAAWNRTAEIAPVYEFPGTGEVFMSVPAGGQVCTDYNKANGPGGVYLHFTGDGHTGPADGWIHERYVSA